MPRWSEFGSPFRNVNSGLDEDKDTENKKRYANGLKNFVAAEKSSGNFEKYDTSMYNDVRVKYSMYYGPALGFIFGKFYADAFTSPKSKYSPKFVILGFTLLGVKYGITATGRADYLFNCKNFPLFPKNVQEALMTGDSRYLREYLKPASS